MSKKKQTKKRPSRLKYEQANPTVSFRLPRETYGQLVSHIQALGQSFGDWVKNHLDQDDARARARAEVLARKRDNLGRNIEDKRQELARLDLVVAERKRELSVPIGARRAEMRKEVDAERQRRMKALEGEVKLTALGWGMELARLDKQCEAKKEEIAQLGSTIFKRKTELAEVDRALANREVLVSRMADEAIDMARRRGVPAQACLSCPGYQWVRSMLSIVTAVAPDIGTSAEAAAKGPGDTSAAPRTDAHGAEEG